MKNFTDSNEDFFSQPPDKYCKNSCGRASKPFYRVPIPALNIAGRWIPATEICITCREEEALKKRRLEQVRDFKSRSFISPRFESKKFENFKISKTNEVAFYASKNFRPYLGDGMMLFGDCGTGKTHLAASVANEQCHKMPVLFLNCPEFLMDLRNSYKKETPRDLMNAAKNTGLLILDDLGAEKATEWAQEILFILINYRYLYKRPIVVTSNFNLSELSERIGKRVASRLAEMCRIINIVGPDYRLSIRKEKNNNEGLLCH